MDFGFVHIFVRSLHGMNKGESLSTVNYDFVIVLQLYMTCLSYIIIIKGLSKS